MTTYNTGNPIGSKDPRDLYDNAENLDEAVNTRAAESWDDRLGVARKTWWGMEQDFQDFLINSGYENIGDYGPGLEITARNQIFWRDGELYRAGAVLELPYTTTGDWGDEEGLFVAVGDQSLRQELASTEGIYMIGGLPFVTPQMFGAIGDGVEDDTESMQLFAAHPINNKYIPSGTYRVRDVIEFPPGDYIHGDGNSSVIHGTGEISQIVMSVSGQIDNLPPLSESVFRNQRVLTFSEAPDVQEGDVIILHNRTDYSFSPYRPYYKDGDMVKVFSVDGNVVTLFSPILSYTYGPTSAIGKMGPDTCTFRDFKITSDEIMGSGSSCLKVSMLDSPVINNVTVQGGVEGSSIYLDRCYNIDINATVSQSSITSGHNYGLIIGNCQFGVVRGSYYGTRHAVTFGGTGEADFIVPNRQITCYADTFSTASQSMDCHGNSEYIKFVGGTFTNGLTFGGRNNTYIGCTIFGLESGLVAYGGEVTPGDQEFKDCKFIQQTSGPTAPFYSPSSSAASANEVRYILQNCSFILYGAANNLAPISVAAASGSRIGLSIDGIRLSANTSLMPSLIRVGILTGGTFSIIRVKGLSGSSFPINTPYVLFAGGSHADVSRFQLPTQQGAHNVPYNTSGNTFTLDILFPMAYPRAPNLLVSPASPSAPIGLTRVVGGYTGQHGGGFRARLQTTDGSNFLESGYESMSYIASID